MAVRSAGASLAALLFAGLAACGQGTAPGDDAATQDASISDGASEAGGGGQEGGTIPLTPTDKLDLLVVVDNSGSMAELQSLMLGQVGTLISKLENPPCRSVSNPTAPLRACEAGNADLVPAFSPVRSLNVGVISTDLGTPGSVIPGCDDAERGDNGYLNPIRQGFAMQTHLPWAPRRPNALPAPAGFRPTACMNDPAQFPAFIRYCSNSADAACDIAGVNASTRNTTLFVDWFKCNAGLFINGCGLESQLEATWRALLEHDARSTPGNPSENANFLRDDALLAILVLSDEEDGSVRNPDHDNGFSAQTAMPLADGRGVYRTETLEWAHPTNPDLRFYLYTPGSRQDPTWSLDRYYNTAPISTANRWTRDLLSLKPGRPERVVFAAITGVPLAVPMSGEHINWNALLGAPGAGGPNDFVGRDSSTSISGTQGAAGPFSMRHANMDPMCSHVVPACRREGTTFDSSRPCSNSQPMAFPSRRIVELARRFDEGAVCNGQPCRNGMVASICASDYGPAFDAFVSRIRARMPAQ